MSTAVVAHILVDHATTIFRVYHSQKSWLLDCEDGGSTLSWSISNCLPVNVA